MRRAEKRDLPDIWALNDKQNVGRTLEFELRKPFDALVTAANSENGWANWSALATLLDQVANAVGAVLARLQAIPTASDANRRQQHRMHAAAIAECRLDTDARLLDLDPTRRGVVLSCVPPGPPTFPTHAPGIKPAQPLR